MIHCTFTYKNTGFNFSKYKCYKYISTDIFYSLLKNSKSFLKISEGKETFYKTIISRYE